MSFCVKFMLFVNVIVICSSFYSVQAAFPEIVSNDPNFRRKVWDALQLLQSKAPQDLNFINQYTKRIQEFAKSGMCSWCNPPTYQLANVAGNLEKYWLASTIAHDSYHSYQYWSNKGKAGGREPDPKFFSGIPAEREANVYQLKVLRQIGAPKYLIDGLLKEDGSHCDLNGDGKCDEKDYALRKYR